MERGNPLILGLYRDNGKQNGNYYNRLGLYRDNGLQWVINTHSALSWVIMGFDGLN